jgi:tetratricopeptide (TPR) repeat protein
MVASSGSPVLPAARTAVGIACAFMMLESAAQSVTVLSTGGDARSCSAFADQASNNLFLPNDALASCTRALEQGTLRSNDRAATLVNRGIVQVALKRYQSALEDYTAAMQVNPALPEAYVSRGNLWFLAQDFAAAIADYDKALSLGLGRAHIAWFNRGLAQERLGNRDTALRDYQQALQLQPDWLLPQQKIDGLNQPAASPAPPPSSVPPQ